MSIEESIQAKRLLEIQVRDLITQFESATNLSVASIGLSKIFTNGSKPVNTMIQITVELP